MLIHYVNYIHAGNLIIMENEQPKNSELNGYEKFRFASHYKCPWCVRTYLSPQALCRHKKIHQIKPLINETAPKKRREKFKEILESLNGMQSNFAKAQEGLEETIEKATRKANKGSEKVVCEWLTTLGVELHKSVAGNEDPSQDQCIMF